VPPFLYYSAESNGRPAKKFLCFFFSLEREQRKIKIRSIALMAAAAAAGATKITVRKSAERGVGDHGWLNSKFTFSFADYSDRRFDSFGLLRVLNDDTVKSGGGFPTHSHANFEIWSYILSGRLAHKDSMGNSEVLSRGDVQFTSAGKGISHSEFNGDTTAGGRGEDVRFLQIWAPPSTKNLQPSYQTGRFPDALKRDAFCPILVPAASRSADAQQHRNSEGAPLFINNSLHMHASIISPGKSLTLAVQGDKAYIHLPIMPGSAGVAVTAANGASVTLAPGDGAFVENARELAFVGLGEAGVAAGGGGPTPATGATPTGTELVVMHGL
jgi:redox-sensitive bicupin YhaK (pirin superfamily)